MKAVLYIILHSIDADLISPDLFISEGLLSLKVSRDMGAPLSVYFNTLIPRRNCHVIEDILKYFLFIENTTLKFTKDFFLRLQIAIC